MNTDLAILAIEDSPADFRLIEREIRRGGLNAQCRRIDTREAVRQALEAGGWDIILSDYNVPGLQFESTLEMIQERRPDVPVLLVSGSIGEETAIALFKLGVWDFVLKDNLTRLAPIIEHSLREAADRRARLAAEQALVESEQRLQLALSATSDGLWDWDIQTDLAYLSPRYYEMSGYQAGDIVPNWAFFKRLVHPDDLPQVLAAMDDHLCGRTEQSVFEYRMNVKDGSIKWMLGRGRVVARDAAGAALRMAGTITDITQRKQAEMALRDSEERFRTLVEEASDAFFLHDADGRFFDVNQRACASLGYTREELLQMTIWDIECDFDTQSARQIWAGVQPGAAFTLYGHHRRKDGSVFPVEVRLSCCGIRGQRFILGLVRDITEREAAEKAVRESEERLRSIGDNLPDGAIYQLSTSTDGARRFDYISDSIEKLTGVSAREVMADAQSFYAGIHPDDRPKMLAAEEYSRRSGEAFNAEARITHRDGTMRWCSIRSSPWPQPEGHTVWYGVIMDINQRVAAKEILLAHKNRLEELVAERTGELRQQTRYLRAVIDNIPYFVWLKDTNGKILAINKGLAESIGSTIEELLGKSDLDIWPLETAERYLADDREVMATRKRKTVTETLPNMPNVLYETFKTPVLDEDGAVLGTVGFSRDISAQKKLEAAREKARIEAERLARVRSDFLANMSHEIRTPLNAVLGFAQIGYRDNDGHKSREIFDHILDSGQMLLGIVNDILDFSKIEAGKLVLDQRPMNLGDIIERCAALIEGRAREKGLAFHVRKAPDLPASCRGDCLRLSQVLGNLLSNAVKFTASGQVALDAWREDDTLLLSVTDTGIGLSAEARNRLFLPFEQADGTTTRKFGGTGLGLAISKRLIDMMHGELLVRSRLGHGSTFEVRLPLVEPSGFAADRSCGGFAPMRATAERWRLRDISILAAEDNEINRLVLQDMLEGEGAQLVLAENGLQAVEQVRTAGGSAFDAVLMDIQMPEMDGYEATAEIHKLAPDLPVIGLTAHAMTEERDRCLAAGMVEHIAKPIELEMLATTLLQHIKKQPPCSAECELAVARHGLSAQPKAPLAVAANRAETSLIDWPSLEQRYRERPDFQFKLLSLTLQMLGGASLKLRDAIRSDNAQQSIFIAHSIKGAAGSIFAVPIADLALRAETALRQESADAGATALQLADGLDALAAEISAHIAARENAARQPNIGREEPSLPDWSRVADVLGALEPLLAAGDTAANILFENSRGLLLQALDGIAEQLGWLIDNYDYDQALTTLTSALATATEKLQTPHK